MFPFSHCKAPGCHSFAAAGSGYCYHHLSPDKKKALLDSVMDNLRLRGRLTDVSLANAEIRGLRAKDGCRISGCNFSFSVFEDCEFTGGLIVSSFFDYCFFRNCTFSSMDIRYSVFAGSTFIESSIHDSTVIHNNFTGIDGISSSFSGNDCYFSSFSLSRLVDTDLEDCNLKRTNFRGSITRGVSLKYSNPEEAFFRNEEPYL